MMRRRMLVNRILEITNKKVSAELTYGKLFSMISDFEKDTIQLKCKIKKETKIVRRIQPEDKELVLKLHAENMSQAKISAILGISQWYVCRILQENGLTGDRRKRY